MSDGVEGSSQEGQVAVPVLLVPGASGRAPDQPAERGLQISALFAAVIAHGLLLLLAVPSQLDRLGDGGTHLEAVTVSLVMAAPATVGVPDAPMLASVDQSVDATLADPSPVEPEAQPAPAEQPVEAPRHTEADPIVEPEKPAEAPPKAEPPPAEMDKAAEIAAPSPLKSEPEPLPEPLRDPEPVLQQPEPPPPAPAAAAPPARPAVAPRASAGTMRAYAKKVALALARSKPKGSGRRGSVTLRFVVGRLGKAEDVTVMKASGNSQLDRVALAAIGRITFPRPPSQADIDQRTFVVPYTFR